LPDRLARIGALMLVVGGAGYGLGRLQTSKTPASATASDPRKPLYYYDPMVPGTHFDKPGKSPFMDMQLEPRYAESDSDSAGGAPPAGLKVDPAVIQSLGVRLASVQRGDFAQSLDATGVLDFNQREVAVVQARAAGFVQRVYARAPGDVVPAGAPLADILVPSWGGAEAEYAAVRQTGDAALTAAARERLHLLGLPDATLSAVSKGRTRNVITVTTPIGGAIQTLDVRQGMTVAMGQNLAQVFGLSTVWLNAAVPEAMTGQVRLGASVRVELTAFPGESLTGKVTAILPSTQVDSRTLTVRIELPNRSGRLRPGMFATVHFSGDTHPALFVPSEAVIRTGTRALVMVAGDGGRFQPVEVRIGRENGDRIEILAGLTEGQKIVASGQFLLDSEASLNGVKATPLTTAPLKTAPLKTAPMSMAPTTMTPMTMAPMTPAEARR
jgi:Cu(I)/Ag(I) efflux system membrane fusion protein